MEATIRVERYADQGRCVGHIDGRVVFIRFALPGELVRIVLDEPHDRDDRFWTGEVIDVLEASDNRISPPWPLAGPLAMGGGAGGADLIHVSLDGQLAWKAATIREQMERLGHITLDDVPIDRMTGDEQLGGLHWRTRIEMIANDDGRPSMRRRGTHMRVPIDTMPLASTHLLNIANECHVWNGGFAPGARIRIAAPEPRYKQTDTTNANTISAQTSKSQRAEGELELKKTSANTNIKSSTLLNTDNNYAVLVDDKLQDGSRQLTEVVPVDGQEFTYTVDAGGFWQMHRQAPIALVQHVLDLTRGALNGASSAVIWDLYSGSGLFTVPLATLSAERVRMLSVEGAKGAVHNAHRNLRTYGLNTVDARCGDVAATLRHIPNAVATPDVVVLDPPRAGARSKVCHAIAESGARSVIYVACDPTSLARDVATLISLGYKVSDIHAFDIYPMTHHVETVCLLTR